MVLAANRSMARLQDEWTKDANNNGAGHRAEAIGMTRVEDANRDPPGRARGGWYSRGVLNYRGNVKTARNTRQVRMLHMLIERSSIISSIPQKQQPQPEQRQIRE